MPSIDGGEIDFAAFAGKFILIVNVASECGYTSQYESLQELYHHNQERLVVVGVPCNDFGHQEPGTNTDIQSFCTKRYGVTFPMTTKVNIKGSTMDPLYEWLTQSALNGKENVTVQWNFHKFLIGKDGQWIDSFPSSVQPLDEVLLSHLELDEA